MKIICSSFECQEKPVEYCKQCSHATWLVYGETTFNPWNGFDIKGDFDDLTSWLEKLKEIDINECEFG